MRTLLLLIIGLFMSENSQANPVDVISLVKNHQQVQALIKAHPADNNEVTFTELELGGQCGIVGCTWHKLVSVVITSKRANAPSLTILAQVTGNQPARGSQPTIKFVDLTSMEPSKWDTRL